MTEMERMQSEAVNSARAMYRRRTAAPNTAAVITESADNQPEPTEPHKPSPGKDVLSTLFEDKEKSLLLLLIVLLMDDTENTGAVLALMYCLI